MPAAPKQINRNAKRAASRRSDSCSPNMFSVDTMCRNLRGSVVSTLFDAMEELAHRRGITRLDRFRLPSILPLDKTVGLLSLALIVGVLLRLTGALDLFNEYEDLFWAACLFWFVGSLAIEGYNRRILRESYELYLWRFDEKTLRDYYSDPLAMQGTDMVEREIVKRHIKDRFERTAT
jgi:hypothetical protein